MRVPVILKTGERAEVTILINKGKELGMVSKRPRSKRIDFSKVKTPFLVISSVLDEFDLVNLYRFRGRVFLDIQGYVREGQGFGKKKKWNLYDNSFRNIFCLKGTKEELQYLSSKNFKDQQSKVLLITDGKRGCEVFVFGKKYILRPAKIVNCQYTIGAGDTFFAYFISYFLRTSNIIDSVRFAIEKTSIFLSLQKNHHHNHLFREEIGCG